MKKLSPALIALAAVCAAMPSEAFSKERADSASVRVHAIIGDSSSPVHQRNITAMNMGFNPAFEDPAAPRFLFLDKEGKVALGIGGNVKAVAMYDMAGAIDDDEFVTNLIPVPFNPARRNRFGATASHSSIFLKLVTSPTRLGPIIVYAQTQFSGDNGGYGLVLKQAYVQVGHLTLGKARSTFADGPAMAPTIDDQGPSGQVSAKNMLVQYATPLFHGFSGAISVEEPKASYTEGTNTAAIAQRIPD
ncbi:MAG: porin, partial [Muribaculaceae bacterium]|nr:porin [Muribaculaceae bacterium]